MTPERHFVGYARDQRTTDGLIVSVDQRDDEVRVICEICHARGFAVGLPSRRRSLIVFHDVIHVDMVHPEGMLFAALAEWTSAPLRVFEFANWFQPGDDWDPRLAESRLEITARGFCVSDLPTA